jgi:plastocyanin
LHQDRARTGPAITLSPENLIVHRSSKAAFAAAICSLALPGAAAAATKTIYAGPPLKKPPAGVPKDVGVNQFFPQAIKVAAGDTITFQRVACPSVSVGKPGHAPKLIGSKPGLTVAGVTDAAGAAAWFNGKPQLAVDSGYFFGSAKSGAKLAGKTISSGFPQGQGAPKPWKVTFPKAGTYEASCPLFPHMTAKITVVGKGKRVPSAKADQAAVKKQLDKAIATAKDLGKQAEGQQPADTIQAGPDSTSGVLLYRFTPAKLTVPVGRPVTLKMGDGTREFHTFTFFTDEKATMDLAKNSLGPLPGGSSSGPPTMGVAALAGFRSEPAGTALTDDGSTHGNGFVNTGLLDTDAKSAFPSQDTITFAKPGAYRFLCLLHPDMTGEIDVQ